MSRHLYRLAALLWGLGLLYLTLRPIPHDALRAARTPFTCLVCGELGVVDVLNNLVLFLPLGLMLRASGIRAGWVLLAGMATTLGIEIAQLTVVAGRDASLSDLITNTLGTAAGIGLWDHGRGLLLPPPPAARRIALAWAVGVGVVVSGTAWLLGPGLPPTRWWGQIAPDLGHMEQFKGEVLEGRIAGRRLEIGRIDDSPVLRGLLLEGGEILSARIVTGPRPSRLAPIVSVFDEHRRKVVLLGQQGRDLEFEYRHRAESFRLRPLTFELDRVLPPAPGDTLLVSGEYRHGIARLSVKHGERDTVAVRRVTSALGWALIWPVSMSMGSNALLLSTLWLAGLAFPAGYYTARGHWRSRLSADLLVPGAVFLASLGIGLVLAPMQADIGLPGPLEWLGALGGFAVGYLLARYLK